MIMVLQGIYYPNKIGIIKSLISLSKKVDDCIIIIAPNSANLPA